MWLKPIIITMLMLGISTLVFWLKSTYDKHKEKLRDQVTSRNEINNELVDCEHCAVKDISNCSPVH